jgi:hypothetical protein
MFREFASLMNETSEIHIFAVNNLVKVQSIAKLREELQYTITEKFTASKFYRDIGILDRMH